MGKRECFYCDDTGFIKGKEVRPEDKLPEQICPYCEIGQAVYRGYRDAQQVQLAKYEALKQSHDKLVAAGKEALDFIGFPADAKALGLKPIPQAIKLEQALSEAEKL